MQEKKNCLYPDQKDQRRQSWDQSASHCWNKFTARLVARKRREDRMSPVTLSLAELTETTLFPAACCIALVHREKENTAASSNPPIMILLAPDEV